MKLPTASELLFSAKSFLAAMLALYIGLRIGLPRPFWAMLTAYVVSNPFSGAVRSKAIFRVGGTVLGSMAAVLLVPALANAPELLSLALALWVGLCLYISLLDRTPRSYVFMLAGYTAALIGFPTVADPSTVFDVALARVEEITLGITCATLIHSLIFPRSLGPVLLARLDHAVRDARHWLSDALRGDTVEHGERDRRKLAGDITELRLMSTHLPFDTSNLRWTSDVISRLQDRLSTMVPLLSAIEDRVRALRDADGATLSPRWRALLDDITDWSRQSVQDAKSDQAHAAELRTAVAAVTPEIDAAANWSTVLQTNLAARLLTLVNAWEECRALRREIDAGFRGSAPSTPRRTPGVSPHALHRDRGLAALSSFAAVIAILGCCAFWIVTAWPSGAAAPMMAAVFCCFFATQDDPVPGIMVFMNYTILSIPVSALYLLVLLPAIHGFEMLALVTAPVFLLLGVLVARPATAARAMAFLFGVAGTLSLQDTGTSDLISFINGMMGQLAGIGAAVMFTRLLRTVSADWTARRLLRAGWAELAALGQTFRTPSITEMSARMLDRIGLLTPRLAMAGPQRDLAAVDALNDLRVGLNMTQLLAARPPQSIAQRPLMQALSAHFRSRSDQHAAAEPALLAQLDDTLRSACAAAQREAVAALVGIRRDLFPDALPYQPFLHSNKAAR
jgi:uncharacterized membrane protein YccC